MQQPSSPSQQHPQQSPEKKRSRRGWWISAAICGVILFAYVLSKAGSQPASTPTTSGGISTDSTQSTQEAQATPTPVPTIAPISLSGVGQQATNKLQLQQGLTIFKLTHNGTANFIVDLLDSNGQEVDNLVNVIGSFNGSKAEGIRNTGSYVLNIQADGKWTITIQQPRPTTAPYITSFSGKGQAATQLFSIRSGLSTIKLTHNGTANFIVDLLDSNGQEVDNLVNVIGPFNGSKAEGISADGIYLFNVQADGNWTISIT